jgi:hypothetical protein
LHSFFDDTHGFAEASLQELLASLIETYGDIDDDALEENLKKITAPWDPTANIIEVFTNGAKCRKFAEDGGEPIADSKYMRILLQIFTDSGVFGRDIEDWEAKPKAEKTVVNLQKHFTEANKRRRKKEESLKATLSANTATHTTGMAGWKYCWSHGVCDHASGNCTAPAPGHVPTATLDNLMTHGGCTFIQRPQGFKPVFRPTYNSNNNRPNRPNRRNQHSTMSSQPTPQCKSKWPTNKSCSPPTQQSSQSKPYQKQPDK